MILKIVGSCLIYGLASGLVQRIWRLEMSLPLSVKAMILLWQLGLVDTLTILQVFVNYGRQYGAIVLSKAD